MAPLRFCLLLLGLPFLSSKEKGKIGSLPSKEHVFRYIPSKELVLDIYHQKVTTLQLFTIFSTSVSLVAGFRFFGWSIFYHVPILPMRLNERHCFKVSRGEKKK